MTLVLSGYYSCGKAFGNMKGFDLKSQMASKNDLFGSFGPSSFCF